MVQHAGVVYQAVEITARELESRLLLAVSARQHGLSSVIGPKSALKRLLELGAPHGVFHTKSLTPHAAKIRHHREILALGTQITSQDEESGIVSETYSSFGSRRYGQESIDQVARVFCWGNREFEWLSSHFHSSRGKFLLTGSPRVDFWREPLVKVARNPWPRPYVLLSSAFDIDRYAHLFTEPSGIYWEWLRSRGPKLKMASLAESVRSFGDELLLISEFANLSQKLAYEFPEIDFILRPHPRETSEPWRALLPPLANLHIVGGGSQTPWLKHAIEVVHNGCTAGLERAVMGLSSISFQPGPPNYRSNWTPNRVGHRSESISDIIRLLRHGKTKNQQVRETQEEKALVDSLLSLPGNGSAELITTTWRELLHEAEGIQNALPRLSRAMKRLELERFVRPRGTVTRKRPPLDSRQVGEKVAEIAKCLDIPTPRVQVTMGSIVLVT